MKNVKLFVIESHFIGSEDEYIDVKYAIRREVSNWTQMEDHEYEKLLSYRYILASNLRKLKILKNSEDLLVITEFNENLLKKNNLDLSSILDQIDSEEKAKKVKNRNKK